MSSAKYSAQVELLIRTIPAIAREAEFALKGGTAINLFVRDLPRLSVDIDLVFLPVAERAQSLDAVRNALGRIADELEQRLKLKVNRLLLQDGKRLIVSNDDSTIKIEVSPVLRGTVFDPEVRTVTQSVEERFGFAEMQVVSLADLYAGKIAAALDRQHPRDLFDVHFLFENEGIGDDLFCAFLVYLVSHNRPPHELLCPNRLDLSSLYDDEFVGMTVDVVPLDVLEATRERLIETVRDRSAKAGPRNFLTKFLQLDPDWAAIGLSSDIGNLPAVRWKLQNLEALKARDAAKYDEQIERLIECISGE